VSQDADPPTVDLESTGVLMVVRPKDGLESTGALMVVRRKDGSASKGVCRSRDDSAWKVACQLMVGWPKGDWAPKAGSRKDC
jgi:hypothetical protein